jgi:hypothetical protein
MKGVDVEQHLMVMVCWYYYGRAKYLTEENHIFQPADYVKIITANKTLCPHSYQVYFASSAKNFKRMHFICPV